MVEFTEEEKDLIFDNHYKTFTLGNLTVEETREICTLDYVLTQGCDQPGDLERYKELSKKRWENNESSNT